MGYLLYTRAGRHAVLRVGQLARLFRPAVSSLAGSIKLCDRKCSLLLNLLAPELD